jgi:multiple sugar transport system permease protein
VEEHRIPHRRSRATGAGPLGRAVAGSLRRMGERAAGDGRWNVPRGAAAVLLMAFFLAPLFLLLSGSLRPSGLPPSRSIELVPADAGISSYVDLFGSGSLRRSAGNSLVVAAIAVPLGVLVGSWAGFAIARLPRRSALVLLVLALVASTVPVTALFVGRIVLFRFAELTDTPVPLIVPALLGVSPLLVLLFAWGYANVPRELYDLAREAGFGPVRTWWHVAVPLRLGPMGVAAAIAFMLTWGNFLDPLLYVYDERWYTLPIALRSLAALPPTDQPLMLAGAVVAIVPVMVTMFILQRRWDRLL